ncbi:low affinity iron permease family protein [Nocardia inohanensis]|uniref:low affinity iron permease family protein n=1 Tax=Nocardia inohanensis TaxID=209246 RepID=UPI0009FE741D|nr:low affinity iron permease family protein [Nocardia inohanensis]
MWQAQQYLSALPDTATRIAGSRWAALVVTGMVAAAVVAGSVTGFPPWWQLTVYGSAALISVLMLFLLQHTANRSNNAVLAKLDELLRATTGAREEFIQLEDRQLHEQERLHDHLMNPPTELR